MLVTFHAVFTEARAKHLATRTAAYARMAGRALTLLLVFLDGDALYETRDRGPARKPPPWADLRRFAAHRLSVGEGGSLRVRLVDGRHLDAIGEFLSDT